MNVVVTGTRGPLTQDQKTFVLRRLQAYEQEGTTFFVGCAKGVDQVVRVFSPLARVFKAKWKELGRAAGPVRNKEMLESAKWGPDDTVVLAFPVESSRGTINCIKQARELGIPVHTFPLDSV